MSDTDKCLGPLGFHYDKFQLKENLWCSPPSKLTSHSSVQYVLSV